jgi:O-glycosyl hydrolase
MRNLLAVLCVLTSQVGAQSQVSVDTSEEYQTIQGFGAFGGIKPYWENPPFYTDPFMDYFLSDLGATIVRTNIFWDLEPVNDNNFPGNLDLSKFNYKAGSNLARQLPYYIALKEAGLKKLIATSWTPPVWMKLHDEPDRTPKDCYNCNNCSVGDPRRNVCGGRLDPKYYSEYAEYLLAYVEILKAEAGIQNEPWFANPFESNVVRPDEYGKLLNIVGRKFRDEGLTTKIFGPEHMAEWSWGVQQNYVSNIFSDGETNPYLDIYAVHGYVDGVAPDYGSATGWTALRDNISAKYGKPLWMTETSGYPQTVEGAMNLAKSMYLALRFGDISSWVYWSVSGEAGSEYSIMANGEPTILYYVSKQFFRYVRPGAVRIGASSSDPAVLSLAFRNASEGSMTIVLINTADGQKDIALDIAIRPAEFTAYRTSATENAVESGNVTNVVALPPQSITTLVGYGPSAPSIDDIPNYYLHIGDDGVLEIPLTGISAGDGGTVNFEVTSSNEAIVSPAAVNFTPPSTTGSLVLNPDTSVPGKSTMTLKLSNENVVSPSDFGFTSTQILFTVEVLDAVTDIKKKVDREVEIYPNPVNADVLVLELSEIYGGRRSVHIMNAQGREIFSVAEGSITNVLMINTESWAPGLYYITITSGRNRVTEKIVKG